MTLAPSGAARPAVATLWCLRVSHGSLGVLPRGVWPLLSIEQRGARDADDLFRLYGDVFGATVSEASRQRWEWQYLENPATPDRRPEIWVAREDGRVLGQYASMPVRLWWGDREVRSSWGMDVFVAAEARGRGVGARLFTAWSDHVEVALGLGLTPSSYGLFKKLRYHDVGPVPFFQKILDAREVARRRLGPRLGSAAAPVLRAALAVTHPERTRPAGDVVIGPWTGFTEEYDALWERARASHAMCVRRDRAYLDWKYARCPHRRYEMIEARRGGRLYGFAVSRHEDHRGLRLGWVIDLFTDAGDDAAKDALLGGVLDGFRRAGVARAQAFSMNGALASSLRRRGFVRGRSPMQFCVRARVPSDHVLAQKGRWHVVFGDSDMDR
jgi:GNAT superfamily N-acetyltransferase